MMNEQFVEFKFRSSLDISKSFSNVDSEQQRKHWSRYGHII